MNALIGYTGFIGSTLLKENKFDFLYRSTNIHEISGKNFDEVVCAGVSAKKWLADLHPQDDWNSITLLINHLKTINCKRFILISTVDVFKNPINVSEESEIDEDGLFPYGLHRRKLEQFVEDHFPNHLIVRLPALVGAGLKKNVIFDFLNNNNLHLIDSRSVFQFYPTSRLWHDIKKASLLRLPLVHLTAEPISVGRVAQEGFGRLFDHTLDDPFKVYDMRSCYTKIFGGEEWYQYNAQQSLDAIRAYANSENQLKETGQ